MFHTNYSNLGLCCYSVAYYFRSFSQSHNFVIERIVSYFGVWLVVRMSNTPNSSQMSFRSHPQFVWQDFKKLQKFSSCKNFTRVMLQNVIIYS